MDSQLLEHHQCMSKSTFIKELPTTSTVPLRQVFFVIHYLPCKFGKLCCKALRKFGNLPGLQGRFQNFLGDSQQSFPNMQGDQ